MSTPIPPWTTAPDCHGGLSLHEEAVLGKMKLKKKRNKLGQQIDRYWKIRDVQRAIKIARLLTDPKSTLKDAKELLNEK